MNQIRNTDYFLNEVFLKDKINSVCYELLKRINGSIISTGIIFDVNSLEQAIQAYDDHKQIIK